MTTNQEGVQQAIRDNTSTVHPINGDWLALFASESITTGTFSERMLAWINARLGTSYSNLPGAQHAFAVDQGFTSWSAMNTLVLGAVIQLSANTVAENATIGTTVGTLSVVNGSGSYTFTETSDPDNKFTISTANLNTSATLDYETATSHQITIQADNGVDTPISRTFTILVTDVDDTAPTITSSSSVSVAENSTLSHALTANESVTWSIVGGADSAQFEISGSTLRWSSNGTRDFEAPADADTNNVYVVQVRATDAATNTTNQTISVTVTDVSEGGGGGSAGEPIGLLLTLTKAA